MPPESPSGHTEHTCSYTRRPCVTRYVRPVSRYLFRTIRTAGPNPGLEPVARWYSIVMSTISDELWNLTIAFRAVRIETARLDAEVLLMHVLEMDRTRLLTSLNDSVNEPDRARLATLANRRLDGEPIAYLTGSREFMGMPFRVTPDVLIPRPETELLVEWAIAWINQNDGARVVDIGTGSGAIAVAIASLCNSIAEIVATDISVPALEIAWHNAQVNAPGRIAFVQSDLLESVPGHFDLILANLPYLTPDQIAESLSIAQEPRLALDGGEGGTVLIDRLIARIPDHLSTGGAVGLELDPGHAAEIADRLSSALPSHAVEVRSDLAGLDRFALATTRI